MKNVKTLELTREDLHRIAYILMIHTGVDDELGNRIREYLQKTEEGKERPAVCRDCGATIGLTRLGPDFPFMCTDCHRSMRY